VASYSAFISRSAARELEGVAAIDRGRLIDRVRALASDPRPPGCEKLSGEDKYRIRHGSLRILYQIDDWERSVTIVKVGHPRHVYRW
jgi:mRNA interferase RelE/StbE